MGMFREVSGCSHADRALFHEGSLKKCNSSPTLLWNHLGSMLLSGICSFCIVAVWELLKSHTFSYCMFPKQALQESYGNAVTTRSWRLGPQKQRIDGALVGIASSDCCMKRRSPALQLSRCFRGHSNRFLLVAYREKEKKKASFPWVLLHERDEKQRI